MTLSEDVVAIIKATVPILEAGGEGLTKHFYGIMLTEFPEVVPFFNKTHQKSGDQPRALARAVLGYAKHIDNLDAIGPVAAQIIHKHCSLNIRAEHYPIVGKCLLRALEEVLGKDVATPAVIDAWAQAYQQLANILITAEESVYQANAARTGGWRDEREFVLVRKEAESEEVTSFYWRPRDGHIVMDYQPGQYIGLILTLDGQVVRRNYSLSQLPNGKEYRISVKKDGLVSRHLHALHVGDRMSFFPPVGDFTLDETSERPLVCIAGGIGITPMVPMIEKTLKDSTRPVYLIHTAKSRAATAFHDHFGALFDRYPGRLTLCYHFTQQPSGPRRRLGKDDLVRVMPADPEVYFVGPRSFLKDMKHLLVSEMHIPAAQCHFEFFGPASDI